jgi:hypothetical protein
LPSVVRTYAPVGKTPVLHEHLSRDHLSAMSAIALEGKLYMIEQERAFKGEEAARFLPVVCWSGICRLRSIEIGSLGSINTLPFDHK